MGTLKPQNNGRLYSNTVIGTLAVDKWAVTFGTGRRGMGGLQPRPVPSSLYQTSQPTRQLRVYQFHIIRRGTVICAHYYCTCSLCCSRSRRRLSLRLNFRCAEGERRMRRRRPSDTYRSQTAKGQVPRNTR